jgi:hypothetical protein
MLRTANNEPAGVPELSFKTQLGLDDEGGGYKQMWSCLICR